MTHTTPRYEFRVFGVKSINPFIEALKSLGQAGKVRHISEIYLMTSGNNNHNIKIRNKRLDIKTLVMQENGLEQWNPEEVGTFPLLKDKIKNQIFPSLGVESPVLDRDVYTLKQFMQELVLEDPDIIVALTEKERFAFEFEGCICEYAEVKINGALQRTLAIESENPDLVCRALEVLKLGEAHENVNYPKALKRVLGLEIDYDINKFF
ncbi:MAG: hypothetical protein DRI84_01160 [Bacteroidetes bacterium]|nr:MAG: hypothetical protein DRI84_01160 [Bacteroidota bacterium]